MAQKKRLITVTPPHLVRGRLVEMDELWSYVGSKAHTVRIWLAIDRATRRIIGVAFGDRSAQTCQVLWDSLPAVYHNGPSYTLTIGMPMRRSCRPNAIALWIKAAVRPIILSGLTTRCGSAVVPLSAKRSRSDAMIDCTKSEYAY